MLACLSEIEWITKARVDPENEKNLPFKDTTMNTRRVPLLLRGKTEVWTARMLSYSEAGPGTMTPVNWKALNCIGLPNNIRNQSGKGT